MSFSDHKFQSASCEIKCSGGTRKSSAGSNCASRNDKINTAPVLLISSKGGTTDTEACSSKNALFTKVNCGTFSNVLQPRYDVLHKKHTAETDPLERVMEKLYIAYQSLSPAIDEIVTHASVIAEFDMKTLEDSNLRMCSVTQEQYLGAVQASKLIQEVKSEVLENTNCNMGIFQGEMIHFPAADFIVNTVHETTRTEDVEAASSSTSSSRIYMEKHVVDQLLQLYNLLHEALQQLYQLAKRNRNNRLYKKLSEKHISNKKSHPCASKILDDPRNEFDHLSFPTTTEYPEYELAKLQEEYQGLSDTVNILRSIIQETSGSITDVSKSSKSLPDARKSRSDNVDLGTVKSKTTDISGARRCILECLAELAEVRKHLKDVNKSVDLNMNSQFSLTACPKKNCCKKQHIPHLHAKLNGIPIVVRLNQETIDRLLWSVESYSRYSVNEDGIVGSCQNYKCVASKSSPVFNVSGQSTKMISSDDRELSSKPNRDPGSKQKCATKLRQSKSCMQITKKTASDPSAKIKNLHYLNNSNNHQLHTISSRDKSVVQIFLAEKTLSLPQQNTSNQGDFKSIPRVNHNLSKLFEKLENLEEKDKILSDQEFDKLETVAMVSSKHNCLKKKSTRSTSTSTKSPKGASFVLKCSQSGKLLEIRCHAKNNFNDIRSDNNTEILLELDESIDDFISKKILEIRPSSKAQEQLTDSTKNGLPELALNDTNAATCNLNLPFQRKTVNKTDELPPSSTFKKISSSTTKSLSGGRRSLVDDSLPRPINKSNLKESNELIGTEKTNKNQVLVFSAGCTEKNIKTVQDEATPKIAKVPSYSLVNLKHARKQKSQKSYSNNRAETTPGVVQPKPSNLKKATTSKCKLLVDTCSLKNTNEEKYIKSKRLIIVDTKQKVDVESSQNSSVKSSRHKHSKRKNLMTITEHKHYSTNTSSPSVIFESKSEINRNSDVAPTRLNKDSTHKRSKLAHRNMSSRTLVPTKIKKKHSPSTKDYKHKNNRNPEPSFSEMPYAVSKKSIHRLKADRVLPTSPQHCIYRSNSKIHGKYRYKNAVEAYAVQYCRKMLPRKKQRKTSHPYAVSVTSLPLDAVDTIDTDKENIREFPRNKPKPKTTHNTYYSKLNYYSNLESDLQCIPTRIYEVRYFEVKHNVKANSQSPPKPNNSKTQSQTIKNAKKSTDHSKGVMPWGQEAFEVRVFEFARNSSREPSYERIPLDGSRRNPATSGFSTASTSQRQPEPVAQSKYYSYPSEEDFRRAANRVSTDIRRESRESRNDRRQPHDVRWSSPNEPSHRHGFSPLSTQPWAPFAISDTSLPGLPSNRKNLPLDDDNGTYRNNEQAASLTAAAAPIAPMSAGIATLKTKQNNLQTSNRSIPKEEKRNADKGVNVLLPSSTYGRTPRKDDVELENPEVKVDSSLLLKLLIRTLNLTEANGNNHDMSVECTQTTSGTNKKKTKMTTTFTSTESVDFEYPQRGPRTAIDTTTSYHDPILRPTKPLCQKVPEKCSEVSKGKPSCDCGKTEAGLSRRETQLKSKSNTKDERCKQVCGRLNTTAPCDCRELSKVSSEKNSRHAATGKKLSCHASQNHSRSHTDKHNHNNIHELWHKIQVNDSKACSNKYKNDNPSSSPHRFEYLQKHTGNTDSKTYRQEKCANGKNCPKFNHKLAYYIYDVPQNIAFMPKLNQKSYADLYHADAQQTFQIESHPQLVRNQKIHATVDASTQYYPMVQTMTSTPKDLFSTQKTYQDNFYLERTGKPYEPTTSSREELYPSKYPRHKQFDSDNHSEFATEAYYNKECICFPKYNTSENTTSRCATTSSTNRNNSFLDGHEQSDYVTNNEIRFQGEITKHHKTTQELLSHPNVWQKKIKLDVSPIKKIITERDLLLSNKEASPKLNVCEPAVKRLKGGGSSPKRHPSDDIHKKDEHDELAGQRSRKRQKVFHETELNADGADRANKSFYKPKYHKSATNRYKNLRRRRRCSRAISVMEARALRKFPGQTDISAKVATEEAPSNTNLISLDYDHPNNRGSTILVLSLPENEDTVISPDWDTNYINFGRNMENMRYLLETVSNGFPQANVSSLVLKRVEHAFTDLLTRRRANRKAEKENISIRKNADTGDGFIEWWKQKDTAEVQCKHGIVLPNKKYITDDEFCVTPMDTSAKQVQSNTATSTSCYNITISSLRDATTSTQETRIIISKSELEDPSTAVSSYQNVTVQCTQEKKRLCKTNTNKLTTGNRRTETSGRVSGFHKSTQSPPIIFRNKFGNFTAAIQQFSKYTSTTMLKKQSIVFGSTKRMGSDVCFRRSTQVIQADSFCPSNTVHVVEHSNKIEQTKEIKSILKMRKSKLNISSGIAVNQSENIYKQRQSYPFDKRQLAINIDHLITDAFTTILKLKSSKSILTKVSTAPFDYKESKSCLKAYNSPWFAYGSQMHLPMLLEQRREGNTSNTFWNPPEYDDNEFLSYSSDSDFSTSLQTKSSSNYDVSKQISSVHNMNPIYMLNEDEELRNNALKDYHRDSLSCCNVQTSPTTEEYVPYKETIIVDNIFQDNHDNSTIITKDAFQQMASDNAIKRGCHNGRPGSVGIATTTNRSSTQPVSNHEHKTNVEQNAKKVHCEDPSTVCWALTKVTTSPDGSQDFEIIESSPIPPGRFLIPSANSVLLLGNQPYMSKLKDAKQKCDLSSDS